jgi:hypothetical protein
MSLTRAYGGITETRNRLALLCRGPEKKLLARKQKEAVAQEIREAEAAVQVPSYPRKPKPYPNLTA